MIFEPLAENSPRNFLSNEHKNNILALLKMTEKKDLLEDLLAAAVNDAVLKVEKSQKQHMSSLTGGMNLPEGFKMPF